MRLTKLQPTSPDELKRALLEDIEALGAGLRIIASGIPAGDRGVIDILAADQRGRLILGLFRLEAGHETVGAAIEAWDWTMQNLGLLRALMPGAGVDLGLEPALLLAASRIPDASRRLAGRIRRPEIDLMVVTLVDAGERRGVLVDRVAPLSPGLDLQALDPELAALPPGEARSLMRRILEELRDVRVEGQAFHPIGVDGDVDLMLGGSVVASVLASGGSVQVRRYGGCEQMRVTTDDQCRQAVRFLLETVSEAPRHGRPATPDSSLDSRASEPTATTLVADALTAEEIAEFEIIARGRPDPEPPNPDDARRPTRESATALVERDSWQTLVEN